MRAKYPRTPHVPWSPGASEDDVRVVDLDGLQGHEVVVTEKLDGENTTFYREGLHARSLDSAHHPSRAPIKALHARIAASIPEGWRVCGENLYARHSIPYTDLDGWFVAFNVWDGDQALSWDDTVRFAQDRGLPTPRVRWRGVFDRKVLRRLMVDRDTEEGWVLRTTAGFPAEDFGRRVAKWVRPKHVQTDAHWMLQAVVPNALGPRAALWTVRSGGPVDGLGALVGGVDHDVDVPVLGDRRLATVLAGRLAGRSRGELLPELVPVVGLELARAVADQVGLHGLLSRPIDEEARPGGLVSLARCVDLLGLHALAEGVGADPEAVRWSRVVAEDLGLLEADPFRGFREALAHEDPAVAAFRLGEALDRRVAGELRSPEEAVAATWGRAPTGRLTVLVGPSGCGKSTLAAGLGRPVVELDALREGSEDALRAGLARLDSLRGHAVWDATGLTRTQRDLPLAVGRRHGCLLELLAVPTSRALAEERNRARARTVPADVVDRQWARVRWPYRNEAHVVRYAGIPDAHQ